MSNNNISTTENNNNTNNQISGHHLDIQLHSAYSLKGGSFLGSDSFFCTFNLRDGKNPKTSSVKAGSDIHWNETFQLDLPSPPEEETLFVNVLGKKKLFQNTLIGRLEIPLCLIIDYTDKTNINENYKVDKKFKLLPRYIDNNFANTGFLHLSLSYSFSTPKNDQINATNQTPQATNQSPVEFSYQCSSCFQFVLPTMTHTCGESLSEPSQNQYPPIQSIQSNLPQIPLSLPQNYPQNYPQPFPQISQRQPPLPSPSLPTPLPVGQSIPLSIPQINQQIHMHNTNINNINNNGVQPQSISQYIPQSPPQTITFVHKSPPQSPSLLHSNYNQISANGNVPNSNLNSHANSNPNLSSNSSNENSNAIKHGFQIGQTYSNGVINGNNQPNGYQIPTNGLYNYQNIQNSLSDFHPNNNYNNNANNNNNVTLNNNLNIISQAKINVQNVPPQSPPQNRAAQPIIKESAPDLISLTPISEQERQLRMLQQIQQKHAH